MKKTLLILLSFFTLNIFGLDIPKRIGGYKIDSLMFYNICPKPPRLSTGGLVYCNDTMWLYTGISWLALGSGGGSSYTPGYGIKIASNIIKIDTSTLRNQIKNDTSRYSYNSANSKLLQGKDSTYIKAHWGSMTWPSGGAGIPNYSGSSSWGTTYSAINKIPVGFNDTTNYTGIKTNGSMIRDTIASKRKVITFTQMQKDTIGASGCTNGLVSAHDKAKWDAGGGGSGTVTTVSVTTANGISGTVANATTTPAITVSPDSLNKWVTKTQLALKVAKGDSGINGGYESFHAAQVSLAGKKASNDSSVLTGFATNVKLLMDTNILNKEIIAREKVCTPTAVKTTNYTANANELIPCDNYIGSFQVTLPNAPLNYTMDIVKIVKKSGTGIITIASQGSDVFNIAAGATSFTMTMKNQASKMMYYSGIWYVISTDIPPTGIDSLYKVSVVNANGLSGTVAAVGATQGITLVPDTTLKFQTVTAAKGKVNKTDSTLNGGYEPYSAAHIALNLKANINANTTGTSGGVLSILPTSNATASPIESIVLTARSNMVFGDVGYIDAGGQVAIGSAAQDSTSHVFYMCIAASGISAGQTGLFMSKGYAYLTTWPITLSPCCARNIYLSTTGTSGNTIASSVVGSLNQVSKPIGTVMNAHVIFFAPSINTTIY